MIWAGHCWAAGGAGNALLRSLVDAVRKHVLVAAKLHADDTPLPVLAPGNGKPKPGDSGLMCGTTVTPATVWFAYSPDRKGIHPQMHLTKFEGVLQADAYAGLNAL